MAKGCHVSAGNESGKDNTSLMCNAEVASIRSCDGNLAEDTCVEGNPEKSKLQQQHTNQEQLPLAWVPGLLVPRAATRSHSLEPRHAELGQ